MPTSPRLDLHRTSCSLSLRGQCAHWLWQSASSVSSLPCVRGGGVKRRRGRLTAPLVPTMPTAWYFLPPAAESAQRTPPKPMVLDSLHGRGTSCAEALLPRESNGRNPALCFRIVPASISVQKRLRAGTDLPELQSTLHPLPFRRGRRPDAPFARASCYIS